MVVNGLSLENIRTPGLDAQMGLDEDVVPSTKFIDNEEKSYIQLSNQDKLERVQRYEILIWKWIDDQNI